jgi:hypothetical protein
MKMQRTPLRDLEELCDRVRAEFLEMPGLCLTRPQIQRLWDLDSLECDAVMSHLVSKGFLRHADHGEYELATQQGPPQEFAASHPLG